MNLRVTTISPIPRPKFKKYRKKKYVTQHVGTRTIQYDRQTWNALVYDRKDLFWGNSVVGPAIIEQDDSTVVVLDNFGAKLDQFGNLVIKEKE
jgi:N-methylhydantoinase A